MCNCNGLCRQKALEHRLNGFSPDAGQIHKALATTMLVELNVDQIPAVGNAPLKVENGSVVSAGWLPLTKAVINQHWCYNASDPFSESSLT
jgi:hypothetical protein